MSNMKNKLSALTAVFVEEVIASIASEMEAAFNGFAATPSTKMRHNKTAPGSRVPRGRKGAKRKPEAVVDLMIALEEAIEANPGVGIEQIGKAMGVPTKELALPVKKLLAARRIRVTGQRRATKYFPGGKISRKKPKPRSASKKKAPSKKKTPPKKKASKKK